MRHFSDIVGDCSGIVYGSFTPPPQTPSPMNILRMLGDKYDMQIHNVMMTHSPYTSPRVDMEISMDIDRLNQLCEDMRKALESSLMDIVHDTSTTPLPPTFTLTPIGDGETGDDRPYIKCTPEQKEKFIQMIERYCDTCFLGDCEAADDYDCRKCLERRVRWEIE